MSSYGKTLLTVSLFATLHLAGAATTKTLAHFPFNPLLGVNPLALIWENFVAKEECKYSNGAQLVQKLSMEGQLSYLESLQKQFDELTHTIENVSLPTQDEPSFDAAFERHSDNVKQASLLARQIYTLATSLKKIKKQGPKI